MKLQGPYCRRVQDFTKAARWPRLLVNLGPPRGMSHHPRPTLRSQPTSALWEKIGFVPTPNCFEKPITPNETVVHYRGLIPQRLRPPIPLVLHSVDRNAKPAAGHRFLIQFAPTTTKALLVVLRPTSEYAPRNCTTPAPTTICTPASPPQ